MCNCVDIANKALADKNTQIEHIMGVGLYSMEYFIGVRTSKVDEAKRGKPVCVTANFCPFCGEKHRRANTSKRAPIMKTRTVQVSEGEKLGPVDWSYDFTSHDWATSHGGVNPEVSARGKDLLKQIEDGLNAGKAVQASTYSDYMQRVLDIGMYDGWPYWRPVPSVYLTGTLGGEWHSFCSLGSVRVSDNGNDAV